jgi:hypothetical protein
MTNALLSILAAFAILSIGKLLSPLLLPVIYKIFQSHLKKTEVALGSGAKEEICAFEDFSEEARSALSEHRNTLPAHGFDLLVDYRNARMVDAGGESYSSIWTNTEKDTIVCLSSIALGKFFSLAELIGGPCAQNFGRRENAIVLESTTPTGARLITYCADVPVPDMPVRYKIKSVSTDTSLERVLEIHEKRLAKWKESLSEPPIRYENTEIFFEQQKKQRDELERFRVAE